MGFWTLWERQEKILRRLRNGISEPSQNVHHTKLYLPWGYSSLYNIILDALTQKDSIHCKTRFLFSIDLIDDLKGSRTISVVSKEFIATAIAGHMETTMVHRGGTRMGWEGGAPLAGLNQGAYSTFSRAAKVTRTLLPKQTQSLQHSATDEFNELFSAQLMCSVTGAVYNSGDWRLAFYEQKE